jgi:hypothetical protein
MGLRSQARMRIQSSNSATAGLVIPNEIFSLRSL